VWRLRFGAEWRGGGFLEVRLTFRHWREKKTLEEIGDHFAFAVMCRRGMKVGGAAR